MTDKQNNAPSCCADCDYFKFSSTYGDHYCFAIKRPKEVARAYVDNGRPKWCPRGIDRVTEA